MKDYNDLILTSLDKHFNLILGVTSLVAFIGSIFLLTADLPRVYGVLNILTGVILFMFFLKAGQFKTATKIIVLIIMTGIIAIASYVGGSFASPFISVFTVSNVMAVLFLKRKQSTVISLGSVSLMFLLAFYSSRVTVDLKVLDPIMTWGLQIISFALLLAVLNISAYAIKNYLIENIIGLEKAVNRANELAYYDQLTNLANIHKFRLDVNERIHTKQKDGFVLLFNLKSLNLINSTLGHKFGDQALVETATLLKDSMIQDEIVARIGGNEFAIWIDGIGEEDFVDRFTFLFHKLRIKNSILKKKMGFYASYAKFYNGIDSFEEVFQRAILTLTYIKSNDINELLSYNDQIEDNLRRKETIKDLVEDALKNKEFTLYYQAKYDSRTSDVIGLEGLARWNSKELGNVSPYEFIPIIESMNMSGVFGEFVIDQVCKDFNHLQRKYNNQICVSINISPTHIMDPSIVRTLEKCLNQYQVPAESIIIEITEDIIIKGIEEVKPILKELRRMKLKISLDDFGTGYSSLNYLVQLELDEIKIDKSFIDQLENNDRIHILLENLIHLSKQLNLQVVAEGVETKDQKDLLTTLGCYIIQGYYYAKPEPL